ncbi:flagellar motor protein MotB [Geomonas subterranea]|uniref:Flagellar motor protein MotB n=1 Tax=Geomonas subterranea TaxID=2847989 RepID=A0ABX8LLX1_9BACT|nr:flagellar motor protein MotB [Geomonas subterranea]QXE91634.1 flagellar motor protein MotB [Geomonas subterranea]QXM10274.1 flagellar motor protein MotB [Geomonas subterranea]
MARKKEPDKEPNHERWLVSYGDLLTLLFAVFVTLYAMSQADAKKAQQVADSFQNALGITSVGSKPAVIDSGSVGAVPGAPQRQPVAARLPALVGGKPLAGELEIQGMKRMLDAYLAKTGFSDRVKISLNQRGLVVRLEDGVFFNSGSAEVNTESLAIVEAIAGILTQHANRCRVEGHTDDRPISTGRFPSNWDLSTARATSLVKLLTRRYGVDPRGISAAGYAEYQPIAANSTAEGRAQNRRVEIVVLANEPVLPPSPAPATGSP